MPEQNLPHHHGTNAENKNIQEQLGSITNFQTVAEVFKQLGDTTRIRIFWLLCHCEDCVVNISSLLDMSSPAVSHHLRPLRNSGLITSRRMGKEVYYRAADTPVSQLLHQMIEQVMEITCPEQEIIQNTPNQQNEYQSEQIETIHKIHEQLTQHMEQRFTIEELSRQYLMNPTTLKAVFKSVYGTSIAAHMKQHRMEQAAQLLVQTNLSIAEIARRVGYDSQSKFTAAFKDYCGRLPRDYRNTGITKKEVPKPQISPP